MLKKEKIIFVVLKVVLTISNIWNRRCGINDWLDSCNFTCCRYKTTLIAFICVATCPLKITIKIQLSLVVKKFKPCMSNNYFPEWVKRGVN